MEETIQDDSWLFAGRSLASGFIKVFDPRKYLPQYNTQPQLERISVYVHKEEKKKWWKRKEKEVYIENYLKP